MKTKIKIKFCDENMSCGSDFINMNGKNNNHPKYGNECLLTILHHTIITVGDNRKSFTDTFSCGIVLFIFKISH